MSDEAPPGFDAATPVEHPGLPDVETIVAELRAEVERNRAVGAYAASLLKRLGTEFHPDEGWEPPEVTVVVESARPIRSTRPVIGGAIVFGKRAVRRMLSWYVAPIAHDQTRFNMAILRELRELERRVAVLEEASAARGVEPEMGRPAPR